MSLNALEPGALLEIGAPASGTTQRGVLSMGRETQRGYAGIVKAGFQHAALE